MSEEIEKQQGKKVKVTIVGDYLVFRNGLKMLLKSNDQFRVVGDVEDFSEASLSVSNQKPDVLLVNATATKTAEFEEFLKENGKSIPTIVLTSSNNELKHQDYLLLGAMGVVTKEQDSKVLFKAIKQVSENDFWFTREVLRNTINRLLNDKNKKPEHAYAEKYKTLTTREKEVLDNVCKGMKNKAIAEELFITETTVRHHLTSIFEKLSVKSRLALAILAFNEGFVEIPAPTNGFSRNGGADRF